MAIRPLSGYIGGKWFLRKALCPMIDATRHRAYVEVFLGMGNIFLGREKRPKVEVINEVNGDVVNVFRQVQRNPEALMEELRYALTSRAEYHRLRTTDPVGLTDIGRAARFLYLRRQTFAGKDPYPAGFAVSRIASKVFDVAEVRRRIDAMHARLDRVVIESLDFAECLATYDNPETFFYLDPPYYRHTHLYRDGTFRQRDFPRLVEALRSVKGKWLMSINDTSEVRDFFAWADVQSVSTRYQAGGANSAISELLISPR